jgi:hypothetical protein
MNSELSKYDSATCPAMVVGRAEHFTVKSQQLSIAPKAQLKSRKFKDGTSGAAENLQDAFVALSW